MYWYRTAVAKHRWLKNWNTQQFRYGSAANQYYIVADNKSEPLGKPKPWVIYLHGGAWTFGSPEQFLPAAHLFIEAGYRVVMPSYVRLTQQGFEGIWSDLLACLEHYQLEFGGAGPTVLAGMSGGGHLAASLASNPQVWKGLNWQTPLAAILCGAVLDLVAMPDSVGLRKLAGKRDSEQFNRANPRWWLERNDSPPPFFLLVHGDADCMVAISQSHCYFEVLKTKATQAKLWTIKDGTHLDACRWMYREDEVSGEIRELLAKVAACQATS